MAKNVRVTRETSSGLNTKFTKPGVGSMTRGEFVKRINAGKEPDYHVRKINGRNVPASNPDPSKGNNLG